MEKDKNEYNDDYKRFIKIKKSLDNKNNDKLLDEIFNEIKNEQDSNTTDER